MKNFALSLITGCTLIASCHSGNSGAAGNRDSTKAPVLTFEDTVHNFGQIREGDKVSYDFRFKNTGASVLVIANAIPSCGCTIPEIPEQPLAPGERGVLKVQFNSAGKEGHQEKTIFIMSNARPPQQILKIICDIVKPNK